MAGNSGLSRPRGQIANGFMSGQLRNDQKRAAGVVTPFSRDESNQHGASTTHLRLRIWSDDSSCWHVLCCLHIHKVCELLYILCSI